jgi:hypothetical protein
VLFAQSAALISLAMKGQRLYIAVTFWGEQYRRFFVDYCLASLLAPRNIPAIASTGAPRLLIATTDADWQAMQSEPVFQAASAQVAIEHVVHNVDSSRRSRDQIMQAMSDGHRRLADRMFEDRAHGVFVYPDSILADGGLARLQELAQNGIKVVMCLAVRFANEGLIDELRRRNLLTSGRPLTIDAEDLARLSIRHMHSETRRNEFECNAFDYASSAYFWTVTPGEDLLFHTGEWAPLLIDYGSLAEHDESALERWTLDGDYIHSNFPDPNDIYIVQDTRELFISGFTFESQIHFSLAPFPFYRVGWLRRALKVRLGHQFLFSRGMLDPVKKEFFRRPIRLRGGAASEAAWRSAEARAARVIDRIANERPSPGDAIVNSLFNYAFKAVKLSKALVRQ